MFSPLLIGVVFGSLQQPKVSLELRGVRMENAAPALATALGMDSLEIGPSLKNDVVLLRVKDVEPQVLKTNLAKVLNATWEHRAEGWRFTQSDDQKAGERKTYDKARYKFFTELVEKSKKKLADLKPFDEAHCKEILNDLRNISTTKVTRNSNNIWRRISKIDEQSPMNRLAYRAAMRMKPEVWMRLTEENPRMVFCTRPNAMQQEFPFRIDDLLSLAVQEQNQWSTYAGGEPLRGPSAGSGEEEGYYSLGSLNEHRQPFLSKDLDTITMTVELTNQTIEFNAYNSEGKSTMAANVTSYEPSDEDYNYDYRAEFEKLKKKMVKVIGDAEEYLDLIAPLNIYSRRDGVKKTVSQSLLAKLLNPEKIDPLSIAAPDVYFANIETPNVIMVMNDNQRQLRVPEFKDSRYARFSPTNVTDADGWFLVSQPNPIATRKQMPDRKKLGPLLRYINANKRPLNLEEQANFALQLPWGNEYEWAYRSHLQTIESNEIETYNNRSALRIYGSLTSGQIAQAKKNGVSFSSLSDDAKREIYRALFYSQKYESRLEMDWQAQTEMSQSEQQAFQKLQELLWGGIYEEKTFALPKGLTGDLVLTMNDMTTSQLYCGRPEAQDGENFYGSGRPMTAQMMGDYLFKCTNPQRYRWEVQDYNKIDENNIRLASQRYLSLKLKVSKLMYVDWSLTQTLITDPTVYTSKTLPKAILDEIKKGYDQAEKNDKEYGQYYNQGIRRTVPPPP